MVRHEAMDSPPNGTGLQRCCCGAVRRVERHEPVESWHHPDYRADTLRRIERERLRNYAQGLAAEWTAGERDGIRERILLGDYGGRTKRPVALAAATLRALRDEARNDLAESLESES